MKKLTKNSHPTDAELADPTYRAKLLLIILEELKNEELINNKKIVSYSTMTHTFLDKIMTQVLSLHKDGFIDWIYNAHPDNNSEAKANQHIPVDQIPAVKNAKATLATTQSTATSYMKRRRGIAKRREILHFLFVVALGLGFATGIELLTSIPFIQEFLQKRLSPLAISGLKLIVSFVLGKFGTDKIEDLLADRLLKKQIGNELDRFKEFIKKFDDDYILSFGLLNAKTEHVPILLREYYKMKAAKLR